MRKLSVFNFMTLNGFYKGPANDISWHQHGGEEAQFSAESSQSGNVLLFGRVTYQMMASFWPSPMAAEQFPEVAEGMNKAQKIVFSTTMKTTGWANTQIINSDPVQTVRELKQQPGNDITILGSGTLLTQLAEAGLIDSYLFMIDPLAIGEGTPIFSGISKPLNLKLKQSRVFSSGTVLLEYDLSSKKSLLY